MMFQDGRFLQPDEDRKVAVLGRKDIITITILFTNVACVLLFKNSYIHIFVSLFY